MVPASRLVRSTLTSTVAMKRTVAIAGVGLGVGICALAATGGLSYLRRRFFGASQAEACRPIILCGPSGAGKSTLVNMLMDEFKNEFGFSVSHTTRKPRAGEKDGVHYHFTDLEAMKKEVEAGRFIESNLVHGNLYGTSQQALYDVADLTQMCILDIDIQGVHACQKKGLDATYILVLPPSLEELERRLRGRASDSEAAIQKRLLDARVELDVASRTRFNARIKNEDRDTAYLQLRELLKPQIDMCQDLRRRRNLAVSAPRK